MLPAVAIWLLATDPTLEGARKLADLWTHARKEDFFGSPRSDRAQLFLSKILHQ